MNKTKMGEKEHSCWLCGSRIEVHNGATICRNYGDCPSRNRDMRSPPVTRKQNYYLGKLLIRFAPNTWWVKNV